MATYFRCGQNEAFKVCEKCWKPFVTELENAIIFTRNPEGSIDPGCLEEGHNKRNLTFPARHFTGVTKVVSQLPNLTKETIFILSSDMAHYRAPDPKREQFRRYLEKAGVVDCLTNVLVALYEQQEKPSNALEFVKEHLTVGGMKTADTEALQQEVSDLRKKCASLTEENKGLKSKLQQYEQEEGAKAD
ncbi:uncharacterized protein V6R79_001917 [Siganus canaliculatus]